jgi:hypothetical protein
LSPLLSEKSGNAGELRLPGRAGKFGLSGSLATKAKLAKAKILKLDSRPRITIICFLFAAQGAKTSGAGRYRRTLEQTFQNFIVVFTQTSHRHALAVAFHVGADGAALAAAVDVLRARVKYYSLHCPFIVLVIASDAIEIFEKT